MTTIVAILIFFKDHFFSPLRQIESKLGGRDRSNMEIQNCSNYSILISNLAPMATIFFVCQIILKLVGRHNRDFLNKAVNSDIDHKNTMFCTDNY